MKKSMLAILALILCFSMFACSSEPVLNLNAVTIEEATASPQPLSSVSAMEDEVVVKDPSDIKIGYALSSNRQYFSDLSAEGFAEYANETGIDYEIRDSSGDVKTQEEDLEYFIQNGFDAIAISPADASISKAVEQAKNKGIPIASIAELKGANTVIEPGDYDFAKLAAETLLRESGAKIAILDSVDQSPRMGKRRQAYDYVTQAVGAVVLVKTSVASTKDAADSVKRILEENPDVAGILCVDAVGLEGAGNAIKELGAGVAVGGAELTPDILKLMKEGAISSAAAQFPKKQGRLVAEAAIGLSLGEYYPKEISATSNVYSAREWEDASYEMRGLEKPVQDL